MGKLGHMDYAISELTEEIHGRKDWNLILPALIRSGGTLEDTKDMGVPKST